jgi:hypothetical protein
MWQVVSIIVGLIAGLAVLFLGHMVTLSIYPFPQDFDSRSPELAKQFIDSLPLKVYIYRVITHVMMCFTSGLTAALVANHGKRQIGLITGFLVLITVIYRDFRYEYPHMYVTTDICLSIIIGFSGILLASRKDDK